jgi:hypothetical protein
VRDTSSGAPSALRGIHRKGVRNRNDILLLSVAYSLSYEVEAPLYPADEGLLRVFIQPQGPEHLICDLYRFAQPPAGGTEQQDVVHEPDVKQPYSLHPVIQLLALFGNYIKMLKNSIYLTPYECQSALWNLAGPLLANGC